jgi:ABC-type uncharacterized transport system ATPase subunit
MIHRGEKVLDETMAGIRARFDPRSLLFEPLDPAADAARLSSLPGVQTVRRDGRAWEIGLAEGTEPGAALRAVASAMAPARIELRRPTLEDVFVGIVSGSDQAGDEERARLRAAVRDTAASMEVRS